MEDSELFTAICDEENENLKHLVPTKKLMNWIHSEITDEDIQLIIKRTAFNSLLKQTKIDWTAHRMIPSIRYDADSKKVTLIGVPFMLGTITATYEEKPLCLRMDIFMTSIVEQCLNYSLIKFGPEDGANHIDDAVRCIIAYCAAFVKTLSLSLPHMNKDNSNEYLKIASNDAIKMIYDRMDTLKRYNNIDMKYFIEEIVRPDPDSFPPFIIWS